MISKNRYKHSESGYALLVVLFSILILGGVWVYFQKKFKMQKEKIHEVSSPDDIKFIIKDTKSILMDPKNCIATFDYLNLSYEKQPEFKGVIQVNRGEKNYIYGPLAGSKKYGLSGVTIFNAQVDFVKYRIVENTQKVIISLLYIFDKNLEGTIKDKGRASFIHIPALFEKDGKVITCSYGLDHIDNSEFNLNLLALDPGMDSSYEYKSGESVCKMEDARCVYVRRRYKRNLRKRDCGEDDKTGHLKSCREMVGRITDGDCEGIQTAFCIKNEE